MHGVMPLAESDHCLQEHDHCYHHYAIIITGLREDINRKKRFLSGIARMRGGGSTHARIFLAFFLEVHFWSIKRVYFFKNTNV